MLFNSNDSLEDTKLNQENEENQKYTSTRTTNRSSPIKYSEYPKTKSNDKFSQEFYISKDTHQRIKSIAISPSSRNTGSNSISTSRPSTISIKAFHQELPESVILREVLYAFQGINSKYITYDSVKEYYVISHEIGIPQRK